MRCSQRKPTCSKCERNGAECIYGLSRRTHKDAPPITITPSQRGGKLSRHARTPQPPLKGDTHNSNSTSNTVTRLNGCPKLNDSAETHNSSVNFLADYPFPMTTEIESETDAMHQAAQLLDSSTLLNDSTGNAAMVPEHFSSMGAEFSDPKPWALGSLFGANHNSDATDMDVCWALDDDSECNCHEGVTELLTLMRRCGSNRDQQLSFDTKLAKLKRCIVSSETSMACIHGHEDSEPIHIMTIAILISYVINDFRMLASESSPRGLPSSLSSASGADLTTLGNTERGKKPTSSSIATPGSSNMSLDGLMEPRMSFGVLELEEDDEKEIRQRLYQLSFRKLERLLSQLTLYLRDLNNGGAGLPDASRHTAFVVACDYTRLWLEKKAVDVKRLFSVPARDGTMDSGLA